jgi:8-hydroxy-5-deazaflavin:NADPH oxidoreductase
MIEAVSILGGTGDEGRGLALRWARAGIRVIIGSRDEQRAKDCAARIGERAGLGARMDGLENAAAVASSEVIVLAVPFEAQIATLKAVRESFRPSATLISAVVPLAATVGDRATRVLGVWQGSAAEQAAEVLPEHVKFAAAFHNISAALLESDHSVECDALICSNDQIALAVARELAEAIPGVHAVDAGALENSRTAEQITALLIAINIRNKVKHSGIRITGLPGHTR